MKRDKHSRAQNGFRLFFSSPRSPLPRQHEKIARSVVLALHVIHLFGSDSEAGRERVRVASVLPASVLFQSCAIQKNARIFGVSTSTRAAAHKTTCFRPVCVYAGVAAIHVRKSDAKNKRHFQRKSVSCSVSPKLVRIHDKKIDIKCDFAYVILRMTHVNWINEWNNEIYSNRTPCSRRSRCIDGLAHFSPQLFCRNFRLRRRRHEGLQQSNVCDQTNDAHSPTLMFHFIHCECRHLFALLTVYMNIAFQNKRKKNQTNNFAEWIVGAGRRYSDRRKI